MIFKDILYRILYMIIGKVQSYRIMRFRKKMGYLGKNVVLSGQINCIHPENLFIYDNSHIFGPFTYIGIKGKFILKQNSAGAQGLTVITGAHNRIVGKKLFGNEEWEGRSYDSDIIVEEDVWIGANVTLLGGCTICRGATIGAGSVVRNSVPPYAIVTGNPGKIIGFCYTPEEAVEHEKLVYQEEERLPLELLEKNYNKFFLKRLKDIKEFTKI